MEVWEIAFISLVAILGFILIFCLLLLCYYATNLLVYTLTCIFVWICPPSPGGSEETTEEDDKNPDEAEKSNSRAIEIQPQYTPSPTPVMTPDISPVAPPLSLQSSVSLPVNLQDIFKIPIYLEKPQEVQVIVLIFICICNKHRYLKIYRKMHLSNDFYFLTAISALSIHQC